MKIYTVWKKKGFSNHNEKCLMNNNNDYVGQKTGSLPTNLVTAIDFFLLEV